MRGVIQRKMYNILSTALYARPNQGLDDIRAISHYGVGVRDGVAMGFPAVGVTVTVAEPPALTVGVTVPFFGVGVTVPFFGVGVAVPLCEVRVAVTGF